MTIYSIYKATNLVNNKSYIGRTNNYDKRRKEHIRVSLKDNGSKDCNTYFHKAIRRHNPENFIWENLYESNEFNHILEMEKHFIQEYNSFGENGYNLTLGGDGALGAKPSKETRDLISNAGKGRKMSEFNKQQLALANIGRKCLDTTKEAISRANKGRKLSDEHKRILYESNKDRVFSEDHKRKIVEGKSQKWLIIFPDGHEEEIINLHKFCKEHNLINACMCKVSKGQRNHHKGFKCVKLISDSLL